MNDATSKPIDIRRDLGELRRAAADTVSGSGQLVCDTVRKGAEVAGDKLAALRAEAIRMGLNGVTAVRESKDAVAEHPVVFSLAGATLVGIGWLGGRNEDKISDGAHKLADKIKQIPGRQLAKDAALVGVGAVVSLAVIHASKNNE